MKKQIFIFGLLALCSNSFTQSTPSQIEALRKALKLEINLFDATAGALSFMWKEKKALFAFICGGFTSTQIIKTAKICRKQEKYREKVKTGLEERKKTFGNNKTKYTYTDEEIKKAASKIFHWGLLRDPELVTKVNQFLAIVAEGGESINSETTENSTSSDDDKTNVSCKQTIEKKTHKKLNKQATLENLYEQITDKTQGYLHNYNFWFDGLGLCIKYPYILSIRSYTFFSKILHWLTIKVDKEKNEKASDEDSNE